LTLVLLLLAGAVALEVCITSWHHGLSARDKPTWIESGLARATRRLAVPARAKAASQSRKTLKRMCRRSEARILSLPILALRSIFGFANSVGIPAQ